MAKSSRKLARSISRDIRESLAADPILEGIKDGESGWVVRENLAANSTIVEYVENGDPRKVWWSIKLSCSRYCFMCGGVELRVDQAPIPLPILVRCKVRKAATNFMLRYAQMRADQTLSLQPQD